MSADARAVLLLCARFGRGVTRPLAPTEYALLADRLRELRRRPEDLLGRDAGAVVDAVACTRMPADRVGALLARGPGLDAALQRWSRGGLWALTRADVDYPVRLRERLGRSAPPILYGCGGRDHLCRGGLAVVGSRDAGAAELEIAAACARAAASEGKSLVSGGAKGVDRVAMTAALEAGGNGLAVVSDRLERRALEGETSRHVAAGRLALISPYPPAAGFSVGAAMGRNKLIYCLADAAFVPVSGGSGGTWTGATECLRRKWVPVYVRAEGPAAHAALIERGARPVRDEELPKLGFLGPQQRATREAGQKQLSLLGEPSGSSE